MPTAIVFIQPVAGFDFVVVRGRPLARAVRSYPWRVTEEPGSHKISGAIGFRNETRPSQTALCLKGGQGSLAS